MSRERGHDTQGAPAGRSPEHDRSRPPDERPPTARRILAAARDILAERGYEALTMTAISQRVRRQPRARVLLLRRQGRPRHALIDTLFQNPDVGLVEEIRAAPPGAERTERFLDWQQRVSTNDRTNRMLYELLPHALHDPEVRARFAEEYRAYRDVDADSSAPPPRRARRAEADALAAVSIAVVEGLGMQRALDPDAFDHERAWRAWRRVVGRSSTLPGRHRACARARPVVGAAPVEQVARPCPLPIGLDRRQLNGSYNFTRPFNRPERTAPRPTRRPAAMGDHCAQLRPRCPASPRCAAATSSPTRTTRADELRACSTWRPR